MSSRRRESQCSIVTTISFRKKITLFLYVFYRLIAWRVIERVTNWGRRCVSLNIFYWAVKKRKEKNKRKNTYASLLFYMCLFTFFPRIVLFTVCNFFSPRHTKRDLCKKDLHIGCAFSSLFISFHKGFQIQNFDTFMTH